MHKKHIIILADGMADRPVKSLGNKTPLMYANTPNMDLIAAKGRTGLFKTIPDDMPTGSAVANLAVLGYDPKTCFRGRGVLEAASMGINLDAEDLAMRVNLVSAESNKLTSHSAGHVTDEEASEFINYLSEELRKYNTDISLYKGLSYRHLLVLPGGQPELECFPPHDNIGRYISDMKIRPLSSKAESTAAILNGLIHFSGEVLAKQRINIERSKVFRPRADLLWPWSPGKRPVMKTFFELYGINGAVISAVDLIKGIGIYAGFKNYQVEGATGLYDTNYEGKADKALEAIEKHDLVFLHVEAADEAGHEKDIELKIRCIEDIDKRLIGRILPAIKDPDNTVIALLPDHATPVEMGSHTREAVPVAIWDPGNEADKVKIFNEDSVKNGMIGQLENDGFIKTVLGKI